MGKSDDNPPERHGGADADKRPAVLSGSQTTIGSTKIAACGIPIPAGSPAGDSTGESKQQASPEPDNESKNQIQA